MKTVAAKIDQSLREYRVFDNIYALPYHQSHSRTKDEILMVATVLFAERGYQSVTMQDIATQLDIKAAALYNHFENKGKLWRAVLEHARDLHRLFLRHMEEQLTGATDFERVLEILFVEPEKMANAFTCYAFTLIVVEQLRDEYARELFNTQLMQGTVAIVQAGLDRCVQQGQVPAFDTRLVATLYAQNALMSLHTQLHKLMGNPTAYDAREVNAGLHRLLKGQLIMDNG